VEQSSRKIDFPPTEIRGELQLSGKTRMHNRTFMNEMLRKILNTPNHPLRMLVDPAKGNWLSRQKYSHDPSVQAGHLSSLHSGAQERLALELGFLNQWASNVGETQGAIFHKSAVNILGIPVEYRSARLLGVLPKEPTLHPGWTPK
jgi:hypothetical protein